MSLEFNYLIILTKYFIIKTFPVLAAYVIQVICKRIKSKSPAPI